VDGPRWSVPLSDIAVDDEMSSAVRAVIESGWWSMGPRVAEFEAAFASFCGAKHAIAVANGTAALHLALIATGCGPDDEVVLPSLTFVAAANMVLAVGARPVFCDISGPRDLNLDTDDLTAAINPATKAILLVHYGGHPCEMDAVMRLARERGIVVIEDAAHAPGAMWHGRSCGTIGAIGCFSFFSNKNLAVGEGGMIVTDDDELAARLRLGRSHGMTTLTWDRHRGHASGYDVITHGYNYRFDEMRAALAMVQLSRLRDGNEARAKHVARTRELLEGIDGLDLPFADHDHDIVSAHHLNVVLLPERLNRDAIRGRLDASGVQTSVHYPPIHRFTQYTALADRPLPVTDALAERLLTLPLFPHMTDTQVELVSSALREAITAERAR
jgi:dTDP-4-amino-4,6-dideoxygalactose transaminase